MQDIKKYICIYIVHSSLVTLCVSVCVCVCVCVNTRYVQMSDGNKIKIVCNSMFSFSNFKN